MKILSARLMSLPVARALMLVLMASFAARTAFADDVTYTLTASADTAAPGQVVRFTVTATNRTSDSQRYTVHFTVPENTTFNSAAAGTAESETLPTSNAYIGAGASASYAIDLVVLGANQSPPDGTVITLSLLDTSRSLTVSRSIVVQSAPALNLQASTAQSSVAPGDLLTYAFAVNSIRAVAGAELVAAIPAGTSFVSASGGGSVGSDGAVHWPIGALGAGASESLSLTLLVDAATPSNSNLPIEATLSDSGGDVERASATTLVLGNPDVTYTLTASADTAAPGQVVRFTVTATNHSSGTPSCTVRFIVPENTTFNSAAAGTEISETIPTSNAYIGAEASASYAIDLVVLEANQAPPNGTTITLSLLDTSRALTVSRSIVVQSAPALNLQASTAQSSVAPGSTLTYNFAVNSIRAVAGAELVAAIPAGTSFVSASGGGSVGSDGAVHWPIGALGAGASESLSLTLLVDAATPSNSNLPIEATLSDSGGDVERASATTLVLGNPDVTYTLTASADTAAPGQVVRFTVTATNYTSDSQRCTVRFIVPENTTFNSAAAGTEISETIPTSNAYIGAEASASYAIDLVVLEANQSPLDGTVITLSLLDTSRALTVSHSIVVQTPPTRLISLNGSLAFGPVTVGTSAAGTFAITNSGNAALTVTGVTYPAGFTGDFSSGTIAPGGSQAVNVIFSPTSATAYSDNITVVSDATAGTNTIAVSGTGIAVVTPPPVPAPVVTSAPAASARNGAPFSYQITADGTPTGYSAAGLPTGLTLDPATGVISGTPTGAAGVYNVLLSVTNAGGTSTFMLTLTLAAVPPTVTIAVSGDGFAVEGGEKGRVTISRTGDTSAGLTVKYKVKGAAKAGVDYKAVTGLATIPTGAAQVKIKIKAINDHESDDPRVAKVKLVASPDASYILGSPATAKVRIIDGE